MEPIENKANRIIRLPEVKALTGLSRSSIYAFIKAKKFPQNLSLGERSVGWYESEIHAWLATRPRKNASSNLG